MKTTTKITVVGLIFVISLSMLMVGCGDKNQSGLTVDEPKITVEYLKSDYVDQLLRDGAEHVFGNIEIVKNEDGSVTVNIEAKQLVEDAEKPDGFYIEDRNYKLSATLASEARCTFLPKDVSLPQIMTTEQFVEAYEKDLEEADETSDTDYQDYKLYDMYIMGDQIELILAKYIL